MTRKLILISVFSLPFTQAMTINLKFPFKIYEIALLVSGMLFFSNGRIPLLSSARRELGLLAIFIFIVSLVLLIRVLFPVEGITTSGFEFRFGSVGDAVAKFLYLLLAVFGFYIVSLYSFRDEAGIVKAWLYGAILASIYSMYLFLTSFLRLEPLLLPGLDAVQRITIAEFSFIRSGTFQEGNFLGLYLLLSTAIAIYARRIMIAIFLTVAIILTFSTVSLIGIISFWFLFYWDKISKLALSLRLAYIAVYSSLIFLVFITLNDNAYIKTVLIEKLIGGTNDSSALSKYDRLNQSVTGINMFVDNPIVGVGLSQYGYYYKKYQYTDKFDNLHQDKMIPNNIYVELLSELGILGFVVFMLFLYSIYLRSRIHSLAPLRYGMLSMFLVFLAFPTYSLMFLWTFWGLIVGVSIKASHEAHKAMAV